MDNLLLIGGTGTGKTYHSIRGICEGKRFAYVAPCRQLAYETYINYADPKKDTLQSGEVAIKGKNGNWYGVYESLRPQDVARYDAVIIDECHYWTDVDRGAVINSIVESALESKTQIILVTATVNFVKPNGFKKIELKQKFRVPQKKEITQRQFYENVRAGMPSLIFTETVRDCEDEAYEWSKKGVLCSVIHAGIAPSDRLATQFAFNRGELNLLIATNAIAQGINTPCKNLLVYRDKWSDDAMYQQKLGRLGRLGHCDVDEVYYCVLTEVSHKIKKKKKITTVNNLDRVRIDLDIQKIKSPDNLVAGKYYGHNISDLYVGYSRVQFTLHGFYPHEWGELNQFYDISYKKLRYAKPILEWMIKTGLFENSWIDEALAIVKEEEEKTKEVIFELMLSRVA